MQSQVTDNTEERTTPGSFSIVIADDDRRMRELLAKTLTNLGHRVVGAASGGEEAIEMIARTHPDLVILDIDMPSMNGIETAQAVLAIRSLPVIFSTGYSDFETLRKVRRVRAASFLTKPFSPAQLKAAVELAVPQA